MKGWQYYTMGRHAKSSNDMFMDDIPYKKMAMADKIWCDDGETIRVIKDRYKSTPTPYVIGDYLDLEEFAMIKGIIVENIQMLYFELPDDKVTSDHHKNIAVDSNLCSMASVHYYLQHASRIWIKDNSGVRWWRHPVQTAEFTEYDLKEFTYIQLRSIYIGE